MTVEEFNQVIENEDMVLLYIGAPLCSVCAVLKPKIENMLKSYPNIKFLYNDISKQPDIAAAFGFYSAPGIQMYIQNKVYIREAGVFSLEDIEKQIDRYYSMFYT